MGDGFLKVRVAAVQASPIFLNREHTTQKSCDLIREAGKNGARIIAFPEGFIPAHPVWFNFHPDNDAVSSFLSNELFKNSVEIPGPELNLLCAAAKEANAYVIIGVCEKLPNTLGTMFNSQIYISPDGDYLGKHQKIMPTIGERVVHRGGFGDTLRVFKTEFGPMSSLICGENNNPLAVFALLTEGTRIHIMSWPSNFSKASGPMKETVLTSSKSFAQTAKAFVISSCATLNESAIAALQLKPEDEAFLTNPENTGGSLIVAPNMKVIAGPLGNEEGILYADIDLEMCAKLKLIQDYGGHYNRPDIFQLIINRRVPQIFLDKNTED